jgi:UDP-N-acetylglucosamine 2-epimerase (non-hydrolysing)
MHAALGNVPNVAMIEPLNYPSFARLLSISYIILTDSGGVQEEAPALGKPVLVLRKTTERAESVATGIAKLIGTDTQRIIFEISKLLDDDAAYTAMARGQYSFGDGQASQRIAKIISNTRHQ